jgi:hypothetical protein
MKRRQLVIPKWLANCFLVFVGEAQHHQVANKQTDKHTENATETRAPTPLTCGMESFLPAIVVHAEEEEEEEEL